MTISVFCRNSNYGTAICTWEFLIIYTQTTEACLHLIFTALCVLNQGLDYRGKCTQTNSEIPAVMRDGTVGTGRGWGWARTLQEERWMCASVRLFAPKIERGTDLFLGVQSCSFHSLTELHHVAKMAGKNKVTPSPLSCPISAHVTARPCGCRYLERLLPHRRLRYAWALPRMVRIWQGRWHVLGLVGLTVLSLRAQENWRAKQEMTHLLPIFASELRFLFFYYYFLLWFGLFFLTVKKSSELQ